MSPKRLRKLPPGFSDLAWRLRLHFHMRRACACGDVDDETPKRDDTGHYPSCPVRLSVKWYTADHILHLHRMNQSTQTRVMRDLLWWTRCRLNREKVPVGVAMTNVQNQHRQLRMEVEEALEHMGGAVPGRLPKFIGRGQWYYEKETDRWRVRFHDRTERGWRTA